LKFLSSNNLAIGSLDFSIYILDESFEEIININRHTNGVLFIEELKNKNIASCSGDCTIKIFKLLLKEKDYEMIQDINFNNKTIFKVFQLSNENLFSCCEDKTLIEWKLEKNHNKNEFVPIKILDCEESCEDAIEIKYNNSLFENKKEIVSCSFNEESLYFWDLESMFKIYKIFDVENLGNNNELFLFKYEFLLIAGKIFLTLINIYKKEKTFLLKTDFICLNIDNFNDNILIADFKGFFHQFIITKNGIQKVENKNHFQFDFGFRFLNCLKKSEDNNFLFVSSDYDLKLYEISNN
jgi:WD40 repeat protein